MSMRRERLAQAPSTTAVRLNHPPLRLRAFAWSCLWAVLAVASCAGRGSAQEADRERAFQLLEAASERYAASDGLCAHFRQRLEIPLLGEERTSEGELCQRRPNLFSMRFTDPDGDAVVSDGSHFWIYYPSISPGQVIRMPLDRERGGMDFYREFLADPRGTYDARILGEETVGGHRVVEVHLEPTRDRGYREATVWIDPGERVIRRVEIVDGNGSVRRVTLTDLRLDPELDPGTFTFPVPTGVTVVSD